MTTTRDALNDAIMEHLGPAALTGGKMSVLEAFELGWQAATLAEKRQPLTDERAGKLGELAMIKWNAQADDYNQWCNLGIDEKAQLICREAEAAHGIKA